MLTAINSAGAVPSAWTALTTGNGAVGPAADQAGPTPFADLFTDTVEQVDQLQSQANATVAGLITGAGVDVHQAMIATQKADMAFEMALSVRNKAVQAYQQVIGMQF